MQSLKTIFVTTILCLLCASFAQDAVTLRFFHKWPEPEIMAFFEEAVADFEAQHPNVTIEMEAVADEPYKDKIRVLMASGDVPDIYFSWSGEFSQNFVRGGQALDLTDAFYDSDWKDYVINSAATPFSMDDKLYGIPLNIDAKFMAYNTQMFDDFGLSVPETTDELLALCDALNEAGVTPIAFGNEFPWAASHYIGELNAKFVPNDVRLADYRLESDTDTLFTDPGYVEALTYFQEMSDRSCFNDGPNATGHSLAKGLFGAGQAAMIYVELVEFVDLNDSPLGEDGWSFFTFPDVPDGRGEQNILTGAPDGFMVSAKTKHPKEAVDFLKFLTKPEIGARYTAAVGSPSASIGAVTAETAPQSVIDGLNAINEADDLALWLDTDINIKAVEKYLPGSQAVLLGTKSPEKVIQEVRDAAIEVKAAIQ